MNSPSVWESHITGRRHLKAVKNKEEASCVIPAITRGEGPVTKSAIIESAIKDIIDEPIIDKKMEESGTFYCKVCDVKMYSPSGWESHITGRRHLKAVKNKEEASCVIPAITRGEGPVTKSAIIESTIKDIIDEPIIASQTSMRKQPQNEEDSVAQQKSSLQGFSASADNDLDTETKEFFGKVPYLDDDQKLEIIEELSTVKITTDEEEKEAMTLISNLDQILMQFKTRDQQSNPQERHAMRYGTRGNMGPQNVPPRFQPPGMGYPVDDNMLNSPVAYPPPRPSFRGRGHSFM